MKTDYTCKTRVRTTSEGLVCEAYLKPRLGSARHVATFKAFEREGSYSLIAEFDEKRYFYGSCLKNDVRERLTGLARGVVAQRFLAVSGGRRL